MPRLGAWRGAGLGRWAGCGGTLGGGDGVVRVGRAPVAGAGAAAADRSMPFVCVQPMVTSWARRAEDLTCDETDEKDAVLIARLTAQLCCYVREPATRRGRGCGIWACAGRRAAGGPPAACGRSCSRTIRGAHPLDHWSRRRPVWRVAAVTRYG